MQSNPKQSERRRIENEILARAENDGLKLGTKKLLDQAQESHLAINFNCECADLDCLQKVPLTIETYENIHSHKARFAITPGHEQLDIEHAIGQHDEYNVIEKYKQANLPER